VGGKSLGPIRLETRTLDQLGERLDQLEDAKGGAMAPRNTISRLTSRIDELTERLAPNGGLTTIVGGDEAECRTRLKEIGAAGGLTDRVRLIITGVKRAESFGKFEPRPRP
jgi:hypothetical protein